jgi:hypothetical protein
MQCSHARLQEFSDFANINPTVGQQLSGSRWNGLNVSRMRQRTSWSLFYDAGFLGIVDCGLSWSLGNRPVPFGTIGPQQ